MVSEWFWLCEGGSAVSFVSNYSLGFIIEVATGVSRQYGVEILTSRWNRQGNSVYSFNER